MERGHGGEVSMMSTIKQQFHKRRSVPYGGHSLEKKSLGYVFSYKRQIARDFFFGYMVSPAKSGIEGLSFYLSRVILLTDS